MNVEFRIPIAPTKAFFGQVEFYNYCLRRLGGAYKNAKLTVMSETIAISMKCAKQIAGVRRLI